MVASPEDSENVISLEVVPTLRRESCLCPLPCGFETDRFPTIQLVAVCFVAGFNLFAEVAVRSPAAADLVCVCLALLGLN